MSNFTDFTQLPSKFIMGIQEISQLENFTQEFRGHPSVIFMGRSNAGKSTILNKLFGKSLAKTSSTPGKTRQINVFTMTLDEKKFFLFDLPGFGHARVSKKEKDHWGALLEHFFELQDFRSLVLFIQDARHPFTDIDKLAYSYVKNYGLSTYLVLNKIDKFKNQKERAKFEKDYAATLLTYKEVTQIHKISALKRTHTEKLTSSIKAFIDQIFLL